MKIMNLESIGFEDMGKDYMIGCGDDLSNIMIEIFTIGLYDNHIEEDFIDGVYELFKYENIHKLDILQSQKIFRFWEEGFQLFPINFKEIMIGIIEKEIDSNRIYEGEILKFKLIDLINKIEIKEI